MWNEGGSVFRSSQEHITNKPFQYGLNNLRQIGYQILQEINQMSQLRGMYRLGKSFFTKREQQELNALEQAFSCTIDPLYNVRNTFAKWSAQCDLELSNYKRNQQIRSFEREKKSVLKLLEKKNLDYIMLSSKMQNILLALEVLERTAIRNDTKEETVQGVIEVITVEKAQPYTALKRVESIFHNAQGYVKIMDKWIGSHTLDFILEIPSQTSVKILTGFVEKKSRTKFSSLLERLQKEKDGAVEIHRCEPSEFHDRFIITQNELWQSGPSLKDLGVTKWGIVSKIGNPTTKRDVEKKFDELWIKSKKLH